MISMKLTGEKALLAKFEKIKLDMANMFAAALVAGAGPVVNGTKRDCPIKTGNLMRSYHVGTKKRNITLPQPKGDGKVPRSTPAAPGGIKLVADELRRSRSATVLVGTDVVYAPPQEFLHKPHLRPALESNRGEVNAEVKRAVAMMIRKESR